MWKEAQQEIRQHWFIDSYVAAYIQGLYRAVRVHPTGLTVNQGISTGLPPELWPRLEGEEVRGLISVAGSVDGTGKTAVESVKAPAVHSSGTRSVNGHRPLG